MKRFLLALPFLALLILPTHAQTPPPSWQVAGTRVAPVQTVNFSSGAVYTPATGTLAVTAGAGGITSVAGTAPIACAGTPAALCSWNSTGATYTLGGTPSLGASLGVAADNAYNVGDSTHALATIYDNALVYDANYSITCPVPTAGAIGLSYTQTGCVGGVANAVPTAAGPGGLISLTAGQGGAAFNAAGALAGLGGNMTIAAGAGGAGAGAFNPGAGGTLNLSGGAGGAGGGGVANGGNVVIAGGAKTGAGTPGNITFNSNMTVGVDNTYNVGDATHRLASTYGLDYESGASTMTFTSGAAANTYDYIWDTTIANLSAGSDAYQWRTGGKAIMGLEPYGAVFVADLRIACIAEWPRSERIRRLALYVENDRNRHLVILPSDYQRGLGANHRP